MTMVLDKFLKRASVRSFSDARHVGQDTLDAILAAAAHAPSTGNMQLYNVIVTRDDAKKAALAALHLNQPAAKDCDVLLTFCADVRRFGQWCRARHAENSLDNAGGKLTAIIDAAIFAQQFVTIAELSGLGCCYLGTVTYDLDGFSKALETPDGVIPLFSVAVGYPAEGAMLAPSDRLPLGAVVSRETYHDATPADIDLYYAEKEQLEESKRFVAENAKETLAQVYSTVRYPRELNLALGRSLLQAIEAQGL